MESPNLRAIEQHLPLLTQPEILDLAARLIALAQANANSEIKETDLSRYRGILKHGPDPLEYQRQARAEWDRE